MFQQITKGIKISAKTTFEKSFFKENVLYYSFEYMIDIQNKSNTIVQLRGSNCQIIEALRKYQHSNRLQNREEKRIIKLGETYSFKSKCLLTSPIGAVKGYFLMVDFTSATQFKVDIPLFQLNTPSELN